MKYQRKMLGRVLVNMGAISAAEIDIILEKLQVTGKSFGATGVAEGLFSEEDLGRALANQFQYEYVDLTDVVLDPELLAFLPVGVPMQYKLVPLDRQGRSAVGCNR